MSMRAGVCVLLAAASCAAADQAVVGASRDVTLYQDGAGAIANGSGEAFFAGANAQGNVRRGVVYFDVAGSLPADAVIESAVLTLNTSRDVDPQSDVSLHRALASWGEGASDAPGAEGMGTSSEPGDATWLHRFYDGTLWASPGGDFDAASSASATIAGIGDVSWSSAQLTADAAAWHADPSSNFGWFLIGDEQTPSSSVRFDSHENAVEAARPRLVIEYTLIPAPGSLVVAALGGGGLLARRRRSRG